MNRNHQGITASDLSFAYNGKLVLQRLSFELETPGFYALFGRSGVGKSTLAKIISGMENGWTGKATFPKRVLYCHCSERFPRWQTIGSHLHDVVPPSQRDSITGLMKAFHLDIKLLNQSPGEISSGQHNRFNVIRYLLQEFDLLILDEALNNVDEPTRLAILSAIKTKYSDRAFLYISHHLFDVISFAKILLVLKDNTLETQIVEHRGLNLLEYQPDKVADLAKEIRTVIGNG